LETSLTNPSTLNVIPEQQCASKLASCVPSSNLQDNEADPLRFLCEEQARLVKIIEGGHNVFFTGGAGTGKSTVLRATVEALREGQKHVAVVTPTGISALNVQGITYFMFAGWRPGDMKKSLSEIQTMAMSKARRERVKKTDVLIIDEISMLESNQFRRLDRACQAARMSGLPFGGIQVVVTGDFYQLPPVKPFQFCYSCGCDLKVRKICWTCEPSGGHELYGAPGASHSVHCQRCGMALFRSLKCMMCGEIFDMDDQWAFCSDTWTACQFRCISLSRIHRQSEPAFIRLLNTLRIGETLGADQLALLTQGGCDFSSAIELSPLRRDVDRKNTEGLQGIVGAIRAYRCHDFVKIEPHHPELLAKAELDGEGNRMGCQDHRFPPLLETKFGMPVILLANIAPGLGLVNGSQGHIVGYSRCFPWIEAQGRHSTQTGEMGHGDEHQFTPWISRQEPNFSLPVVRFENNQQRVIYPVYQDTELGHPPPFSVVARTQIPLLPAWAITIHKSQGMTLEKAIINLDGAFARQMGYVALSRVRSLAGLQVKSWTALKAKQERGVFDRGTVVVRRFMEECFGRQEFA
jgi:ATP-dependent DNA helicase PIF1